jgi:hypothetical protein
METGTRQAGSRTNGVVFTIPGVPVGKQISAIARFKEKLLERDGCLVWSGVTDRKGYARFRAADGKKVFVHRFAYELSKGAIPQGLVIDHLCRNRACCNPDHLEAVTNEENIRRGNVGSPQRSRTHCPQGHEYSPENTYVPPSGERQCRICKRENGKKHEAKRTAKRAALRGAA